MRLGQYDTIETLSEGASGIVYLAVDIYSGFPVAIKVLKQSFHGNPIAIEQFKKEATVQGQRRKSISKARSRNQKCK